MWLIQPTWIQEFPTKDRPTYVVNIKTNSLNYTAQVPVDSLIYARDLNPLDPYGRGVGVGASLGDEIDIDEHAAKMVGAYFQNGAMPSFIVSMEGASKASLERAKARWSGSFRGFARAYQTFFTGSKLSAQRLDTTFKDMALVDIRKAQRDLMISASGMPPEKVGVLTSSNRSTIEAADLFEAKNVVIPDLEMFRLEFQTKLLPMYDDRLVIDYADPTPMNADREAVVMAAVPHYFTVDEHRAVAGHPPLPEGEGAAFLVDPGKIYVKNLTELTSGTPIFGYHLAAGSITNNEIRAQLGLPPVAGWGDERTVGFYQPGFEPGDDEVEDLSAFNDDVKMDDVTKTKAKRAIVRRTLAKSAMRRILNALSAADINKGTTAEVHTLMGLWGEETIHAIDNNAKFDDESEAMKGYLDDYASTRAGMINTTTRNDVRRALEEWDGEDLDTVIDDLKSVFDHARIERSQIIAGSESVRASQFAAVEAYKQSGIVAEKEWIAVADGRTREAHLAMDGQIVDLDKEFEVPSGEWKGSRAMQPGGFGIGALDINCRCQSAPIFDNDDDTAPRKSPEERAAFWEQRDAKLRKHESRIREAFEDVFDKQGKETIALARKLLD
jgi:hypothetical protein